jgi:4'-phosphopantetheinyl transferase
MITPLEPHQIHIVQIDLDQQACLRENLILSEQQHADKMRITNVRQRFINSRGFLRQCLSHYLQQEPNKIELSSTEKGKLFLENSHLFFNLAHSKNMALFAFNHNHEIGIDIEQIRPLDDLNAIAERVFTEIEIDYLTNTKEDKKLNAFFKLWTRKEATIKASGEGLTAPLKEITTTDKTGKILKNIPYLQEYKCKLKELKVKAGYAATVAAQLENREIQIIPFPPNMPTTPQSK